jgi:hypothetical protein
MATSLMVRMQLPQWLARFNRRVINPVQCIWARWAPTFGILEHVGRRSGMKYRTPLNGFSTDDGIAILTSVGQGRMRRYGRTFTVTEPRVMPKSVAAPSVKDSGGRSWRTSRSNTPSY